MCWKAECAQIRGFAGPVYVQIGAVFREKKETLDFQIPESTSVNNRAHGKTGGECCHGCEDEVYFSRT
jgi:hypothetical protein